MGLDRAGEWSSFLRRVPKNDGFELDGTSERVDLVWLEVPPPPSAKAVQSQSGVPDAV